MSYKIHISDRRYEEYKFVDSRTLDNSHVDGVDVDPISNKLFNQDIFKLLDDGNIIVQKYFYLTSGDNETSLKQKTQTLEYKAYPEAIIRVFRDINF